jgi:hypothetical protein
MHCLGRRYLRRSVLAFLPALLLTLAAGCTQNPGSQFHSYEGSTRAEGPAAGKDAAKEAAAPTAVAGVKTPTKDPAPAATDKSASAESKNANSSAPVKTLASAPTNSVPGSSKMTAKGTQAGASSDSRKVQVLVPNKTFRNEGESLRVSYDDIDLLKVLNMDPVAPDAQNYMPAWLKSLDGRRIRIRGFMYPTFQQTGVHAFGLARDNQICCFGRNPKIYDVFDVVLKEGTTTNYIPNRPFDVVGVFHIRPEAEAGKLYRLYEMDDAAVISR